MLLPIPVVARSMAFVCAWLVGRGFGLTLCSLSFSHRDSNHCNIFDFCAYSSSVHCMMHLPYSRLSESERFILNFVQYRYWIRTISLSHLGRWSSIFSFHLLYFCNGQWTMATVKYKGKGQRERNERISNRRGKENLTEICMRGSLQRVEWFRGAS